MHREYAHKRRVDTEKGYVMVEFSNTYGGWIWTCEWGHRAIDFEGEAEALWDYMEHDCQRTI